MVKIIKVKYETEKGERIGFFIKVLKGYVPINIVQGQLEHLEVIEERDLEINEIDGRIIW